MSYTNVGAKLGNSDVPSKKALKEAVKAESGELSFYGTSDFTPFSGGLDAVTEGTVLVVVGPNPYNSRKWYANVTRKGGKLVVS